MNQREQQIVEWTVKTYAVPEQQHDEIHIDLSEVSKKIVEKAQSIIEKAICVAVDKIPPYGFLYF